MIEWLFQQSLVTTFFVVCLLLFRRPIRAQIGAIGLYKIWCLIPLLVAGSLVFLIYHPTDRVTFSSLITEPYLYSHQVISQYNTPFLLFWTTGALIVLCAISLLHFRFLRMLSTASYLKGVCFLRNIASERTRVPVYISNKIDQPMSVGILRPKIFIPNTFSQLPHKQQSLIFEHEWVHCNRRDGLWNAIFLITLCIFWFSPIIWWGYLCFRNEQELSCDSYVLKGKTVKTRAVYANMFLKYASSASTISFSVMGYGSGTRVKERILNIKSEIHFNKTLLRIIATMAVLIFLFTGVLLQNSHLGVIAEPIHQVSPVYPSQAAELGLVGEVELTFSVETDGSVSDIEVAKYMGSSLFVPQAVSSFSLWIYKKPIAKIRNQRIIIAFELAR